MKLFAVIGMWDYEGKDAPAGIYSTQELAEAALDRIKDDEDNSYDDIRIYEYDLDKDKR